MKSTLSEASTGSLSLDPNNIIPLDFKSIRQVPKSHAWSTRPLNTSTESIPIIDLKDSNSKNLIKHACEEWGIFQITNHGVPLSLLGQVEEQTWRLFKLPAKQKLETLRSSEGLTGYGMARIGHFFTKKMWSEGFTLSGSSEEHARLLWPNEFHTFSNVMVEYQKEMMSLSGKILLLMLSSLGLTHEDLKWVKYDKESEHPQAVLQLNSYPICPDPTRAMGLAPHTDSSLITLLYQSNTSGLQIRHINDWVSVSPVTGALIVNCGDLLHMLLNGRFKTALHRAMVNKAQHRISVAYFVGPPRDLKISPLIKLVDDDHPMAFGPVTWEEYLDLKATYFNKALNSIRIKPFSCRKKH